MPNKPLFVSINAPKPQPFSFNTNGLSNDIQNNLIKPLFVPRENFEPTGIMKQAQVMEQQIQEKVSRPLAEGLLVTLHCWASQAGLGLLESRDQSVYPAQ